MSDLIERWYIRYRVEGFPGEHRAGPYSWDRAVDEMRDISGYAGVHGCEYEMETMARTLQAPAPQEGFHAPEREKA